MDEQKLKLQNFYTHTEKTLGRSSLGGVTDTSKEMFEGLAVHRYGLYPYIPKLMEFSENSGKSVLEVGVGEGTDHVRWHIHGAVPIGIDLTMRHARMTYEHVSSYGYVPRIFQADAENLPFANASFDLVYSCGVLFLCPDLKKAVAEIYRVLKPGGRVIALFYARTSLWLYSVRAIAGVIFGERRFMDSQTFDDWYAGDGYDYPHVQYVDEIDLRKLFDKFDIESMHRDECNLPGTKGILKPLLRAYAPWLGYYLTIKAKKA